MTEVVSGQVYRITNVRGGTVVDLSGVDNRAIIGYTYHGGDNQRWRFQWTGNSWTIQSVSSNLYLAIEGDPRDGAHLVAVNTPFQWHIWHDEVNQNTFRFFLPSTHYNWDLAGHGNNTPGTPIQLWWIWEGTHQTWRIERA